MKAAMTRVPPARGRGSCDAPTHE
eukprot:IDg4728t1